MKRVALSLAFLASLSAGTAVAQAPAAVILAEQSGIPPNCTLDPWTGRMTCHIWPTCTLDPWTGKMNCPVPRPGVIRLS